MKDKISLALLFAIALSIESATWVWLPALVAVGLLQIDKIEKLLKQNLMDKKTRKFRQMLVGKDYIADPPPFTDKDVEKLKIKAKK